MKTQFALFFALIPLYAAAAGLANAVEGKPLPQVHIPAIHANVVVNALRVVADHCQSGECIAQ